MGNKRTIITLPEEDKGWLESYGKAHDVSVAEAIRRSIRKLREDTSSETYKIMVKKTRGLWKKGDGLRYQNEIRSEWHEQ
jgi:hypothetical protein